MGSGARKWEETFSTTHCYVIMTMEMHIGNLNFLSIWKILLSGILILFHKQVTRETAPKGGRFPF